MKMDVYTLPDGVLDAASYEERKLIITYLDSIRKKGQGQDKGMVDSVREQLDLLVKYIIDK